jgi:DNA-binding MarR family transcriptional regulator
MNYPQATTSNLGFLLAKASARWNELLLDRFAAAGFPEVKASHGSVLVPLLEQDGLRMGEIGRRARLSKPSMTALVRQCEEDGFVRRDRDASDGRAFRVVLTERGRRFGDVVETVLGDLDALVEDGLGTETRDALERALKGVIDL